jgi:hypothetical protein
MLADVRSAAGHCGLYNPCYSPGFPSRFAFFPHERDMMFLNPAWNKTLQS